MSQRLISRSPDLKRLRDEGYDVAIRAGHLVLAGIPYVNAQRQVRFGSLVAGKLDVNGDVAAPPTSHVVRFAGEYPCDQSGAALTTIVAGSNAEQIDEALTIQFTFSRKPVSGSYPDYYAMMTAYVAILMTYVHAIDRSIDPRSYPVVIPDEDDSVFTYLDTASSRAGISSLSTKLEVDRVAIVGLGGTGSYVLDLVAKTPVKEIHLFDSDYMLNHNAFRSPGAPTIERLRERPRKVTYFGALYSAMHRHVVPHPEDITETNVDQLSSMSFVFLCADRGETKRMIATKLCEWSTPFIDVGMGLYVVRDSIAGTLRVTASDGAKNDHVLDHISGGNAPAGDDVYPQNIQVADLNALNSALAVVRWKKMLGFYNDLERERSCTYDIDGNELLNEDHAT